MVCLWGKFSRRRAVCRPRSAPRGWRGGVAKGWSLVRRKTLEIYLTAKIGSYNQPTLVFMAVNPLVHPYKLLHRKYITRERQSVKLSERGTNRPSRPPRRPLKRHLRGACKKKRASVTPKKRFRNITGAGQLHPGRSCYKAEKIT